MPGCGARSTALGFGILLTVAARALAQPETAALSIVLRYEAASVAACPSEAESVSLVQQRVPGLTRALGAAGAHVPRIRLAAREGAHTAELELTDRAGAASLRSVTAASCREATEAAALIAAVFVSAPAPEPAPTTRTATTATSARCATPCPNDPILADMCGTDPDCTKCVACILECPPEGTRCDQGASCVRR